MPKVTDQEAQIGYPRNMKVDQDNFPSYKTGVNRREQNKIKQLHELGYDPFQASHVLGIVEKAIRAFWPKQPGKIRSNAA